MWELAYYNCIRRRNKSLFTIFISGMVTTVFVLFISLLFIAHSGIKLSMDRMGADVILIPQDTEISNQEILFTGISQMKYFSAAEIDGKLPQQDIQKMTPQFFLKTLPGAGCCSTSSVYRIVGIDTRTDFILQPWLKQNHKDSVTEDTAVIGANIRREFDSKTFLLNHLFRITGVLYPTGTGMDDSIFVDITKAREMGKKSFGANTFGNRNVDDLVTSMLIKLKPGVGTENFIRKIDDLELPIRAVSIDHTRVQLKAKFEYISTVLFYLLASFVLTCGVALIALFSGLTSGRKKEIGYLRSIGFKEKDVIKMVMTEVILQGSTGGLLGGALGACLVPGFIGLLQPIVIIPEGDWTLATAIVFIILGMLFSSLIAIAAALAPALNSAGKKPHEAISEGAL
jgi:putative ABC transport system permease protein